MLPCNVIVQETAPGRAEIAAIDPRAAMERVGNPALVEIARDVAGRLERRWRRCEERSGATGLIYTTKS
jgi:hypothetical protein